MRSVTRRNRSPGGLRIPGRWWAFARNTETGVTGAGPRHEGKFGRPGANGNELGVGRQLMG